MPQTLLLAIAGHPIGHTLSPVLHTEAGKATGVALSYGVVDVPPAMLAGFCRALRSNGFRGCNVTIPHKEAVLAYCDDLTPASRALGAVNVILVENGRLLGHNTDVDGIIGALEACRSALDGAHALIVGAGGAARAAAYGLGNSFGVKRIDIVNRTESRGDDIVKKMRGLFPRIEWRSSGTTTLPHLLRDTRLIVQATSVGMAPSSGSDPLPPDIAFSKEQIIFDIVYNPLETALLRRARHEGARTIQGLEMFLRQGARAFELWTGTSFPMKAGREAVLGELHRRMRSEGDGR